MAGETSREDAWATRLPRTMNVGVKGREERESLGTACVRNGREGGQQYQLLPRIKGGVCQVSLGTLGVATSFGN